LRNIKLKKFHVNILFGRSLTPISTAATVATSDDGILTTFTESDTYEPIETFQDLFNGKTTGNKFEANSSSKKQAKIVIISPLFWVFTNLS